MNESNINNITERNLKIPAFIFIYSSDCLRCKKVHQTWKNLMKKYESDPDILIGECNSTEYEKECEQIFRNASFPSFIIISNNTRKSISPQQTIESFIEEAEKLKNSHFSIQCSFYPNNFSSKYPAFILTSKKSDTKKCAIIQKIIEIYPLSKSYLYINSDSSQKESFIALKSTNETIQYKGPKKSDNFIDFLNDVLFEPFGNWNYSIASLGRKRIGLLIHDSDKDIPPFLKAIQRYDKDFSLCKMYSKTFESIFHNLTFKKKYLPAFAISNSKKTKFLILINVLKNSRFHSLLNNAVSGMLENKAIYDLSALFPIPENSDSIETENLLDFEETKAHSKLATSNFKLILFLAFVVTLSAVFAIIRFINKTENKVE